MTDTAGREAAARWLAAQNLVAVRVAREIIERRTAFPERADDFTRAHESGCIHGLRLALSYLSDRPGDISDTGAEGFISSVEQADSKEAR